ncbi:MAG: D-alanyl-D-alanine carboxypeptidase [Alphaproteobacteria bacterium]|nr:D-alanyl-D-alanine carboxypeptidase [Alphaproteobacteria bacterium]MDE2042705.1 D-alanyl-D-alanine carboxypeptidase [Alphaproteobacteria bacterium]MDE2340766.1 D-alanyl-D-alanine carboxypeptidase [Alphaproteobacteria bacterium]
MKPVALIVLLCLPLSVAAAPPSFTTNAPIAYLYDVSSGAELYAKDPDRHMPPASLAKMMTVYVAFDMIRKGELKLDQKFLVTPEIWKKWNATNGGSTMFLAPGDMPTVADLLSGIVTLSGNDACATLATGISGSEGAFADRMNAKAKELGLTGSHFGNSIGWPDGGVTEVTARDLAHLAAATITQFPDLYKRFYGMKTYTWGKTTGGKAITQDNRNPILGVVPGADGLKTGHTEEAGFGFTGSAEQNGRRLVEVLAGMRSKQERVTESVNLINWGFQAWSGHQIYPKGKEVGTAKVQMGSSRSVGLVADQDVMTTMPAGTQGAVNVSIAYDGPIRAPVSKGQHIADLVMTSNDAPQQRVPLYAENDVGEAGFFMRIWLAFLSLFGG